VRADVAPLSVTAAFGAGPVSSAGALTLTLSRPLSPAEGRLAVLVGTTDWSDFFTFRGTTAVFSPGALALPAGTTEVAAYLVTPAGEWRPVGRFPLSVVQPAAVTRTLKRTLDLAFKAQVGEGHRPEDDAPPRATFQDLALQAVLDAARTGKGNARKASFKMVGTTDPASALRFSALGEAAPQMDLAGYALGLEQGRARLALGDLTSGTHRHLIERFQARGAAARIPLGPPADLTLAAFSGSQIVGWDNIVGLDTGAHRILLGTLGLELVPARPGSLRLEASAVDGSVLPLANYNQGLVRDAATSRGLGLRLTAKDSSGRIRVDGSLARSRFENASDAQLEAGLKVAGDAAGDASARYARVEVDPLRLGEGSRLPLAVTLSAEHERVDPLYRSVGVAARADLAQNTFGAGLRLGEAALQIVHARKEDNLGHVRSILTTLTRQDGLQLSLPLASLLGSEDQPATSLPLLSYALARVRQHGTGLPPDSDFAPSHVPDQLSVSHTAGAQWQLESVSFGYSLTATLQDNRQPGREAADFAQQTHQVTFGFVRSERVESSLDAQLERSESRERSETDRVRRLGLTVNGRLGHGFAVTAVAACAWNDAEGAPREGRNLEADVQASWRLGWRGKEKAPAMTFFVRGATQRARTRTAIEVIEEDRAAWQLSVGVSMSAF
jgi:hypothetical protein